mgnify:CR=1 FL=1
MVYTVFYKTSSFVGYCFLSRYSIHPQRHDVFSFMLFEATLVKFQICSFIAKYSYKQLKWVIIKKPEMRDAYVRGVLYGEYLSTLDEVDETFDEISKDFIVIINGDV